VPVRLSKRAQRLIAERGSIRVVVTSRAVNGAGTRRTSFGRVTLVAARPATERGR
jgi:hypothetical protein